MFLNRLVLRRIGSLLFTALSVTAIGAPPTVSLVKPSTNVRSFAPATLALEATAADADGSVAKIEFYSGSTLLGADTSAPYTLNWQNITVGTYSITARAIDNAGESATSSAKTITVVDAPPPSATPEASFGYDPNGNLIFETDALGRTKTQTYDRRNRITEQTFPSVAGVTGVAKYQYNAFDQLTQVTDPRNKITSYTANALGDVSKIVSPDTGTTTRTFDTAGNVITEKDARGIVTRFSYDALNRLTNIDYPTDTDTVIRYDETVAGRGRVTSHSDEAGTTTFDYHPSGRIAREQFTAIDSVFSKSIQYQYDTSGRLTSIAYPSGNIVTFTYNTYGRLTNVTGFGKTIASNIQYEPSGAMRRWTWPTGQQYTRTFDQSGRINGYSHGSGLRNLSHDGNNNVTKFTSLYEPYTDMQMTYDERDRLATVESGDRMVGYGYDANSNRIHKNTTNLITGNMSVQTSTIASSNNRILNSNNPWRTYSYDTAGNITSDGIITYAYSEGNRLKSATSTTGTWTYRHDAMGRRRSKRGSTDGATVYYMYDSDNRYLGEYTATGDAIAEYVYIDGIPVAVSTRATGTAAIELFLIESDHNNTPRVIKDSLKRVRWRWSQSDPFGTSVANETPTSGLASLAVNLRFPGQLFDRETGLVYNMNRTYSPAIGRFLQSDATGLLGGLNTYAYAEGNPVKYVDSDGNFAFLLNPVVLSWTTRILGAAEIASTIYDVYQCRKECAPSCAKKGRSVFEACDEAEIAAIFAENAACTSQCKEDCLKQEADPLDRRKPNWRRGPKPTPPTGGPTSVSTKAVLKAAPLIAPILLPGAEQQ